MSTEYKEIVGFGIPGGGHRGYRLYLNVAIEKVDIGYTEDERDMREITREVLSFINK